MDSLFAPLGVIRALKPLHSSSLSTKTCKLFPLSLLLLEPSVLGYISNKKSIELCNTFKNMERVDILVVLLRNSDVKKQSTITVGRYKAHTR